MQEEFFGFGELDKLEEILIKFDSKKVFLVTGEKSFTFSGAEKKIRQLLRNILYVRYISSPNPNIEIIEKGIKIFKEINADLVIAIGGGSAIDIAKSINVLACQNGKPQEYIEGKKLVINSKPLIAILTTSGTGSEATHFATIYIDKKKYSLADKELMLPNISIVDPSLTESLPKYITAYTGMDAICQGIESFWSIKSTKKSRKYAVSAVEIGLSNIEKAVNNPDKDSRLNMAKAANLSGKAINITKTTACHSVSYPITSYFSIPHGHAVALTMPSFIHFNANVTEKDCNDKRGVDYIKENLEKLFLLMDCNNSIEAKIEFEKLMVRIGIRTKLSELGINKNGIMIIIDKGFTPNRMQNNPRKVTRKDLEKIFNEII